MNFVDQILNFFTLSYFRESLLQVVVVLELRCIFYEEILNVYLDPLKRVILIVSCCGFIVHLDDLVDDRHQISDKIGQILLILSVVARVDLEVDLNDGVSNLVLFLLLFSEIGVLLLFE